jgi:hypothetical protein
MGTSRNFITVCSGGSPFLNVLVVGAWRGSGDEQNRDQQAYLISSTLQEQEGVLLSMNDRAVGWVRMVVMLPLARA